ncbi:MAG: hypothetical protein ACON39_02500 [Coraliomargaritaceae bacterium]
MNDLIHLDSCLLIRHQTFGCNQANPKDRDNQEEEPKGFGDVESRTGSEAELAIS